MLPRERVMATLDHREPDRIPWGEHLIDFNIYEAILGRPSLVNTHFKEREALWQGRRQEVVAHYQRDLPDLTEALGLDIVTLPGASTIPPRDDIPEPMEKIGDDTYRDADGNTALADNLVTIDCKDNVLVCEQSDHVLAAIGLRDLIVVHTPDATLICPKDQAQRLKDLVALVRQRAGEKYL